MPVTTGALKINDLSKKSGIAVRKPIQFRLWLYVGFLVPRANSDWTIDV